MKGLPTASSVSGTRGWASSSQSNSTRYGTDNSIWEPGEGLVYTKEREAGLGDDNGGQRGKLDGGVGAIKGDLDVSADNMDHCAERKRRIDVARTAEGVEGGTTQMADLRPEAVCLKGPVAH